MRISNRLKLGFLAIAMWVAVLGHISLYQLGRIAGPLGRDIPESLKSVRQSSYWNSIAHVIRYYQEVSTQSARNYAFSQDKIWEQRYKDAQAKLDGIINEAIGKLGEKEQRLLSNVNDERLALVEMQNASIELVNNENTEEAIQILESSRYWEEKERNEQRLENYIGMSATAHEETLRNSSRTVDFAMIQGQKLIESSKRLVSFFTAFALVLALGSGLLIARSIYVPLRKLEDATREIGKGKLDTQIEIKSDDELSRVVDAFKKMKDNLKRTTTSIDNLNREIADRQEAEERTKLACEELRKANQELKLMQSERVQTAKLASIGQLAAGVAHELSTPIGFVASNFETLEGYIVKMRELLRQYDELIGDIEDSKNSKLVDKASVVGRIRDSMQIGFIIEDIPVLFDDSREGLERVINIMKTLKDFSRIDKLVSIDKHDINDGIKSTLVVAKNEYKYDADVEMELSEVPPIICNAGQINQVLLSILVNAAQAIKSQQRDKKGSIKIRTYATDVDVICEISDNGPGIEPHILPEIFDPFFTTKPVGEGTGLGLSIAYDIIVTKHNGRLFVDSSVGEGTKFTIELPISRVNTGTKLEVDDHGKKSRTVCG